VYSFLKFHLCMWLFFLKNRWLICKQLHKNMIALYEILIPNSLAVLRCVIKKEVILKENKSFLIQGNLKGKDNFISLCILFQKLKSIMFY
jgi:hypothetical protein